MTFPPDHHYILSDLLKAVSRSFYLTIRVLPKPVREPITIAYLLARAADTVADKSVLPQNVRLDYLKQFQARLRHRETSTVPGAEGRTEVEPNFDTAESELVDVLPNLFDLVDTISPDEQKNVRKVVVTLIQGMEIDLTTFPPNDSGEIGALETLDDLDRYTYYVAGCVGEFWTDVMMSHLSSLQRWDKERMVELGVGFGKALQMTNILRDVPKDLRIGRCYLPRKELQLIGLVPDDLLSPTSVSQTKPLLAKLLRGTLNHYAAAEQYITATPIQNMRLRLAMIWPVLIGLGTLAMVAKSPDWRDPQRPSKVSRRWVYWMMVRSIPCAWSNSLLKFWVQRLKKSVEKAL